MKKQLQSKLMIFLCFAAILFATSVESFAQTRIFVYPTQLYRFRISNTNLGYLLTQIYSEGVNHGYAYNGVVGSIYVPPAGYVPLTSNLVPIHQWTVIQNGRAYTYYSYVYSTQGSNYTYDGIRGYMFGPGLESVNMSQLPGQPPQNFLLHKIYRRYSSSKGFWYPKGDPLSTNPVTYITESDPTSGFSDQGTVAGWLPTPYGTCPGCPPTPPVLGAAEAEKLGQADNQDDRMAFVQQ